MTILKILQYPSPRLQQEGIPVAVINEEVSKTIDDMFETHYAATNCAALAATQLDLKTPWRITVIDFSSRGDQPLCLINPEIIEMSGEQYEPEGCMSVCSGQHLFERVKRAMRIKVRALDRTGKLTELEAQGFMAKCIQHEVDHLNGLLYLDRLSPLKKRLLINKINKLQKR